MSKPAIERQRISLALTFILMTCWLTVPMTVAGLAVAEEPTLTAINVLKNVEQEQKLVVHDGQLMPQALATHLAECPPESFVSHPKLIQMPGKPLELYWLGMGPDFTSGDLYRFVKREKFIFQGVEMGAGSITYETWDRGTPNWKESISFDTNNDGQPFGFQVVWRQPTAPALTIDDLLNQWKSGLYHQKEFTPILRCLGSYKPNCMGYSDPTRHQTELYCISLNLSRGQADAATQSLQNLCRERNIPFALTIGNYQRMPLPKEQRPPLDVTVHRIDRDQETELYVELTTPPVPRRSK